MTTKDWTAANNELLLTLSNKHALFYLFLVYHLVDLCCVSLQDLCETLTEVTGDIIWDVDLPISPLPPHAASAGARVCIFLCLTVNGDVSSS